MDIIDTMTTHLHFKVRGTMRGLHPTTMPLWSFVQGVRENAKLAELTAVGRALDPEAFKAWKPRNLMSVYFGVRFRDPGGRADEENVAGYTGLAGFDFDNAPDPAGILEALRGVPQVVCAGISASGSGVWCVARVAAATATEYRLCFASGVAAFEVAGLGAYIDRGAHDPTRARFAASSPECWWRYDARGDLPEFLPDGDLSVLRSGKAPRAPKIKLPEGYKMSPELAFDEVRAVLAGAAEVADGDRNNEKARQCGVLKGIAARAGVSPEAYVPAFVEAWDAQGSTHKKTVSIANRLLAGKARGR